MPTRLVREGINSSFRINQLSPLAELFYRRLMTVADDYGRYYAAPATLRGACWPTCPEKVTESQVAGWLEECCAGDDPLIILYESKGCLYLQVSNFNQQTRAKSKFPEPDNNCLADASQVLMPSRSRNSETEAEAHTTAAAPNAPETQTASAREVLENAKKIRAINSSPQYTMDESYQDAIVVARQFWPDSLDEDFIEAHRAWRILSWEQKAFALENLRGKQEREPGAGQFVKKNFAAYMASAEWKRRPREPTANSRNQVREVPVCEYPPVPTFRKPQEEYATTD